ncbi:hypothetical protein DICVIV_07600 [Dictyocaulus viviparus]|uniref:SANTA domain-containing protein n=1 Tax=Dictyocaulus viviparus TaxID=29172 RepID=A0A0D8XRF2_DICVI|nr:hypothetical protein DICVIV_07600 [Dictyocaulus viviparus]
MSTKYRLVGNINILDSATAGFPKEFVAKFIHGFPPDWRTTITDLYNRFIWHLQANGEFSNPDDDIHHSAINIKDNNNLQSFRNESEIKPTRRKSSAKHCDSSVISHKSFSRKVEAGCSLFLLSFYSPSSIDFVVFIHSWHVSQNILLFLIFFKLYLIPLVSAQNTSSVL